MRKRFVEIGGKMVLVRERGDVEEWKRDAGKRQKVVIALNSKEVTH